MGSESFLRTTRIWFPQLTTEIGGQPTFWILWISQRRSHSFAEIMGVGLDTLPPGYRLTAQ